MTGRPDARRVGALFLACAGLSAPAAAQSTEPPAASAPPRAVLAAGWQFDPAFSGDGASTWSIDWTRQLAGGRVLTVGGGLHAIDESRWFVARAGTTARPWPKVTVSGQGSVGGGHTAGAGFAHLTSRGDLTFHATSWAAVSVGDEYISIDRARGHLVRTNAALRASTVVAVDLGVAASAGGNLNATFAVARVDVATRPVAFFGGAAAGRTTPEVLALTGAASGSQSLRQAFMGISTPVWRGDLRVAVDVLHLPAIVRRSVLVTVVVPVGR